MTARERPPTLGILLLENAPLTMPGAMGAPESFAYPTLRRTVRGAWVENVVHGDPVALDAYVEAARALERSGAAAITTNCGFTVLYQSRLSARVPVPVATSSLLLLPLMARMLPPDRAIGVVTYDARRLGAAHLEAAGAAGIPLVTAGIEDSETWAELGKPEPQVGVDALARDVLAAVRGLLRAHPEVASLLLECAAFCPVSRQVRAEFGLPALDFLTLADTLVGSLMGGRHPDLAQIVPGGS
jgi:hypothetical protein